MPRISDSRSIAFLPLDAQAARVARRRAAAFDGGDLHVELANRFGERVDFVGRGNDPVVELFADRRARGAKGC